ncbi:hypothetical protein [Chitinimonas taiwanensis]|uniref:hypothetical protein n=1 Tax=Chitinimonas taiwanensis TaxID=240412 RepID=UPI000A80FCE4|nr:hypothetical protein [Chitinimonas taiwanensis]
MKKLSLLVMFCLFALPACSPVHDGINAEGNAMKKAEALLFDVNLYSYLERPIFDVYLNGKFIGDAGGQPHRGAGGLMTGVEVPLGPQTVTWRLDGPEGMPGIGETVKAINQPILKMPADNMTYLGVHIYPDNTVELIPEPSWPEKSPRGLEINRQWELQHAE